MKALCIFLQLIILGAGGIMLAALVFSPIIDFTAIIFLFVFVAFLLALTLALKEHTLKRLNPVHTPSLKPIGIVLLLLGTFSIFYGTSFLLGYQPLPNGKSTCRSVCGLILLVFQLSGETVAGFFAFGLYSSIGMLFCFFACKVMWSKQT